MEPDRPLGRIAAIIASIAIIVAPFLALLYSLYAGLAVMAAALAITAFLLRDALTDSGVQFGRLRLLVALNLGFALVCVVVLVALIARG